MINKKYLIIGIIIVVIIVIAVLGIYFFKGDNNNSEKIVEKGQQNFSGEISSLSSLNNSNLIIQNGSYNPYIIINSLNKTKCSEIKDKEENLICINGIGLIEKATSANNLSLCFDKFAGVDSETRILCRMIVNQKRMLP